jgi:hypothetical protein
VVVAELLLKVGLLSFLQSLAQVEVVEVPLQIVLEVLEDQVLEEDLGQ